MLELLQIDLSSLLTIVSLLGTCLVGKVLTLKENQDKRDSLARRMKELADTAKDQDDGWTDEQRTEFDEKRVQIDKIDANIKQIREDMDRAAYESRLRSDDTDLDEPLDEHRGKGDTEDHVPTRRDRQNALRAFLLNPTGEVSEELLRSAKKCGIEQPQLLVKKMQFRYAETAPRTAEEARQIYADVGKKARKLAEKRAQGVGTAAGGGNLVPDEMMREIEIAQLKFSRLRMVATVLRTATGANLPIPTCDDTANEGELITEHTTANEQDVVLGQLILEAFKFSSKMVRVSIELLQDSATNVEVLLGRLVGERLGRVNATEFTTGSGVDRPKGVVTGAVDSGITLASNTALSYDELVDLVHSVDEAYRDDASFMMHDSTLKQVRKVKDADGNPLWMPGLAAGMPDTILGHPYHSNSKMPTGASAKSIIFGDLSKLIIRDVLEFDLMRLDERYAELAQVAFLGWQRSDSDVVDAGAGPIKYATAAP